MKELPIDKLISRSIGVENLKFEKIAKILLKGLLVRSTIDARNFLKKCVDMFSNKFYIFSCVQFGHEL